MVGNILDLYPRAENPMDWNGRLPGHPLWLSTSTKADRKRKKVERQNKKKGRKLNGR